MSTRRTVLAAGAGAAALAATAVLPASARADTGVPWHLLGRLLRGELVRPGDPGYAVAKQLYIQEFDAVSPQAVAYCESTLDVVACVLFARVNQIPAAARSGGNSAGGFSTTTGLVIDVSRLNSVTAHGLTVTLGPGAQAVDILAALSPRGIALPTGLSPTVAAGGYLQGGGLGLQTRLLGLASDRLLGATVVLSSGAVVQCSETAHPDLFWALRGGGGGNFGIVTSFTARAANVSLLTSFTLVYPYDAALDVLTGWQDWSLDAPREISSGPVVQLATFAPGAVPGVVVTGAAMGPASQLNPELDRLVAAIGRPPLNRAVAEQAFHDTMMGFWGCATKTVEECHVVGHNPAAQLPRPAFGVDRSRLFSAPIPAGGLSEALRAFDADRRPGQVRLLRAQSLGGAVNDIGRTATAYVHRDSLFVANFTLAIPAPPTEEEKSAARAWAGQGFAVLDRYSNHETYQNFIDPELPDWRGAYYAENYAHLVSVKRRYDPAGFFRFPQSIG